MGGETTTTDKLVTIGDLQVWSIKVYVNTTPQSSEEWTSQQLQFTPKSDSEKLQKNSVDTNQTPQALVSVLWQYN